MEWVLCGSPSSWVCWGERLHPSLLNAGKALATGCPLRKRDSSPCPPSPTWTPSLSLTQPPPRSAWVGRGSQGWAGGHPTRATVRTPLVPTWLSYHHPHTRPPPELGVPMDTVGRRTFRKSLLPHLAGPAPGDGQGLPAASEQPLSPRAGSHSAKRDDVGSTWGPRPQVGHLGVDSSSGRWSTCQCRAPTSGVVSGERAFAEVLVDLTMHAGWS